MMASTLLDKRLTRSRFSAVLVVSLILICLTSFPTATAQGPYAVTFASSGLGGDETGTTLVSLTVISGWCDDGTTIPLAGGSVNCDEGTSLAFSFTDPVTSSVSGKQYRFTTADRSSPYDVTGPITITGTYVTQWEQTFEVSANVVDATGTLVSLTPSGGTCTASSIDTPGGSVYCDEGTSLAFSFQDPVSSSVSGKQYRFVSADETSPISVTAPETVTGTYATQWEQTFEVSANVVDATGTVVTVNGVPVSASSLPYSVYVDQDSSVTYSYADPVSSTVGGKRYSLTTPAPSPTSPYTVDGTTNNAVTVTGTYATQWEVTFSQTGVGSDFTGTVATIASTGYDQSALTTGVVVWVDDGGTVQFSFASSLSPAAGKQYVWTDTTGLSTLQTGTITVSASGTVTGNYKTQYQVSFGESGLDGTATGTVVTIGGVDRTADLPIAASWFDAGTTYSYSDPVTSSASGKQFKLTGVTGPASPIASSGDVLGTYKTQYYITVTSPHGSPTLGDWVDAGQDFSTSVTSPDGVYVCDGYEIDSGGLTAGTSYTFTVVDAPHTVEYVWRSTVVTITITSDPSGSGYVKVDDVAVVTPHDFTWTIGDTHTLEALSPVSGGTGVQYVWTSWSDTGSQTHTYTVPGTPETVTANYKTQYLLDIKTSGLASPSYRTKIYLDGRNVGTAYDGLDFTKWFDEGAATGSIGVDGTVSGGTGTQYVFTKWDEDSSTNNPRASETMSAAKTFTAVYKTQFKLTMATNFGTTNPSAGDHWYDASSTFTISATAPTPADGEQYVWNGWTGSGSGSYYTGTEDEPGITMDGPVTETASWTRQCEVTFDSSGIGDDTAGTVVTVNGNAKIQTELPYTALYDWGSTISYSYTDPVVDDAGKQYVWLSTSGFGQSGKSGGFTVTATATVTATYKTQYSISFASSGLGSDAATAIIVIVNNVNYQQRQLPYTAWYDSDSTISYAFSSTVSVVSGVQYAWASTSGLSQTTRTGSFAASASGIVTGTYTTGYAAEITAASEAPDPAALGSRVTLTATVKNTGATSMASVQVKIKLYRPDATLASTLSGVISSLGTSGASQEKSVGPLYYSLPTAQTGAIGDWTYSVEAYYGVSLLASKTDPSYTFAVSSPLKAAEVADVSVNPDPSPQGTKLTFAVTVHNAGNVNLAVVTVRLSIYKPGGVLVASPSGTITSLTAGGVDKTAQIYYATASTAPIGTWTYDVKLYSGTTPLGSKTGQEFEVEARTITGEIVSVTVVPPDSVSLGGKVTFTVEVNNTGNVAWSGIVRVKIFRPSNGPLVSAPQFATGTVQPGDTFTCTLTWSVPSSTTTPTGSYSYTVFLVYGSTTLDSESDTITVNGGP
jgi:hypothetical protein